MRAAWTKLAFDRELLNWDFLSAWEEELKGSGGNNGPDDASTATGAGTS